MHKKKIYFHSNLEKSQIKIKERYSKLVLQKEISKKVNFCNKPLGPRQRILETDRSEFSSIVEVLTGNNIDDLLSSLKPNQWRDFIVRLVCSSKGENGDKLRKLWIQIYKGDLIFGIRDERRKAKESNWPLRSQNPGRRDRNSWIAYGLRKSCLATKKFRQQTQEVK